jgi:hypothetical protein
LSSFWANLQLKNNYFSKTFLATLTPKSLSGHQPRAQPDPARRRQLLDRGHRLLAGAQRPGLNVIVFKMEKISDLKKSPNT